MGGGGVPAIRRKKKYLWFRFPTDPIFSADPIIFQHDWLCDPIFSGWLRAAAKMASVVTLIIWRREIFLNIFPTYRP
jgi:hypothetical protein